MQLAICKWATALAAGVLAAMAHAVDMPPRNPWLADSSYSMGHGDSAQQDSVAQRGPVGPTRILRAEEIQYQPIGPAHFGANTSGVYADGRRVFWSNGIDRIAKLDFDSFAVLSEYFFPGAARYTETDADESIASFDGSTSGVVAIYRAAREMSKLRDLAGVYTVLDRDNIYYIGSKNGSITSYGDADPRDSRSPIVKRAEFSLPAEVTGTLVGMNMSYDGWLLVATEHGYVVAIKRDFSGSHSVRLQHSEGAEQKATGPSGQGWVRNGMAVDDVGGIYIASQQHMHKVVWDGKGLSTSEADGAWSAPYLNGLGTGTGSTPSLMGFGDEDRFVVISDGEAQMNMVLFWREAIPADWTQLDGAPDRRIAGMLPVTMDDPDLSAIQSEQSVVVSGYGACIVNNTPRNVPWYLPESAGALLISLLGSSPEYQPYGVQKFVWNPVRRSLEYAWVNREVSSPSAVPIVSAGSNRLYVVGARDNRWTLEAIDWSSGRSDFHYVIGGQRYNVLFSGTLLDEAGRIHYGTPWGRVRLAPLVR